MNRLILLGNGFDLAHGMKTSYNDFILDYMIKCLTEVNEKNTYTDEAIEITTNNYHYVFETSHWKSIEELVLYLYNTTGLKALFTEEYFTSGSKSLKNIFSIKCKYPFIKTLFFKCGHCNWVEIENEYYRELKNILKANSGDKKELITALNGSLSFLIQRLEDYLSSLPDPEYYKGYQDILRSTFTFPIQVGEERLTRQSPENTMVLNFNYTSTIEQYKKDTGGRTTINYIHGKINDKDNPIIFGFGDEIDKDYQQIEDDQNNHFFTYIKSFWYFRNNNYRDLSRFIDESEYQVYILGHSCGLSDRTMLNMVFEHPNCKDIQIFYYEDAEGHNNFTELTQEISRHFKNKAEMRKKIVPFSDSQLMPQVPQ